MDNTKNINCTETKENTTKNNTAEKTTLEKQFEPCNMRELLVEYLQNGSPFMD